jgi:hypothetical protein
MSDDAPSCATSVEPHPVYPGDMGAFRGGLAVRAATQVGIRTIGNSDCWFAPVVFSRKP